MMALTGSSFVFPCLLVLIRSSSRSFSRSRTIAVVMGVLESTGIVCRLSTEEPMDMAVHPALPASILRSALSLPIPKGARDVRYAAAHAYLRPGTATCRRSVLPSRQKTSISFGDTVEACNPLFLFSEHGLEKLRQIARLVPLSVARLRPRVGYACAICWIKVGPTQRRARTLRLPRVHGAMVPSSIRRGRRRPC